jgi:hypothetical protein
MMTLCEAEKAMATHFQSSTRRTYPAPPQDAPVVFLDFDGVLNSDTTAALPWSLHTPYYREIQKRVMGLDATMVRRVNRLCHATGAKVILSTSWAAPYAWDAEGAEIILRFFGFEGEVVGRTERKLSIARAWEIERWLREHRPTKYVILDDDEHHQLSQVERSEIRDRWVKSDTRHGLTDAETDRAIRILREGPCSA